MEQGKSVKRNFAWNIAGSIFECLLSFVLLIAVNRTLGEESGGVFSLAFSHATLMFIVGTLEVRPFQCTDVQRKYPFSAYFTLRILSCAVMMAVSLAYALLMDADPVKKRVVMYVCVYKAVEAVIDCFTAMYQQRDRIEYSGKVSVVRVALSLAAFIGILLGTRNLEWACVGMIAAGLATLLTYNLVIWRKFDEPVRLDFAPAGKILVSCLPLFISSFVMLYIGNAPKYAIDTYCTDVIQNRYSILFMPAFVINLFAQFGLRPLLTEMAKLWTGGERRKFAGNILKMAAGIAVLTGLGVLGARLAGIPVLELLYGADLKADRGILLLVMGYGGLNAVNTFLYDMIAVTRKQKWMLIGYGAAALAIFLLAPRMVQADGMRGAIHASMIAMALLDAVLAVILAAVITREGKE